MCWKKVTDAVLKHGGFVADMSGPKKDSTGWWKGELRGLVGFFPSNFSEVLPASPTEEATLRRMSMAPKPVKDNPGTAVKTSPASSSEPGEFVKAKHNYKGSAEDGELSFSKGDVLKVLNRDESGWWKGELNGRTGFFPHNFVVPHTVVVAAASPQPVANSNVAAAATPPAATVPQATTSGNNTSAATKGKQLLKNKVVAGGGATAPPAQPIAVAATVAPVAAPVAAAGPNAAQTQQIASLEKEVERLRAELEAARRAGEEAKVQAVSESKRATEQAKLVAEEQRKAREAEERAEEEQERRKRAEAAVKQWEGEGCEDISDLNELRDLKHKLKAALERVTTSLNQRKACPSCEIAVKDCIVVPCLHAFCQKCGERNKKQVKCSVCGVAPERIYLLGKK